MADTRRGHRDDSIYFDHRVGTACLDARLPKACSGRWRGVISLGSAADGKRIRRKVSGQSKADMKTKLGALHDELRERLHTSVTYNVRQAVEDWLTSGLDGRSAKTVSTYREVVDPLTALIGSAKLRDLTARQVRSALVKLSADRSTRTLQISRNALVRAIRLAEANDLVDRNVRRWQDRSAVLQLTAERLRREYFRYLGRLEEYADKETRNDVLKNEIKRIMKKGISI
jgi:hypothetical protein